MKGKLKAIVAKIVSLINFAGTTKKSATLIDFVTILNSNANPVL